MTCARLMIWSSVVTHKRRRRKVNIGAANWLGCRAYRRESGGEAPPVNRSKQWKTSGKILILFRRDQLGELVVYRRVCHLPSNMII